MKAEKDQDKKTQPVDQDTHDRQVKKRRSSAFKETSRGDEKSTRNVEEEAGSEQEGKEAMRERD
jgi:hypothetical protein